MTDQIRIAQRRLIHRTITDPSAVNTDDQIWVLLSEAHVRATVAITSGEMLRRWFNDQRPDHDQVSGLCDLLTATAAFHDCHVDFDPELTDALIEGAFGNIGRLVANEARRDQITMIAIAIPALLAIHMNLSDSTIASLVDTIDNYINDLMSRPRRPLFALSPKTTTANVIVSHSAGSVSDTPRVGLKRPC